MKSLGEIIKEALDAGRPLSQPAIAELRKHQRLDALRLNASNILRLLYEGRKVTAEQYEACREFFPEQCAEIARSREQEAVLPPSAPLSVEVDVGEPLRHQKQELFAQYVAAGMAQAEAYRKAYNAGAMQPRTIWTHASRLAAKGNVRARIERLQRAAAANSVIGAREFNERLSRRYRECDERGDLDGMAKIGALMAKTVPGLQAPSKVEVKDGGVTDDYAPKSVREQSTEELVRIIRGFGKD